MDDSASPCHEGLCLPVKQTFSMLYAYNHDHMHHPSYGIWNTVTFMVLGPRYSLFCTYLGFTWICVSSVKECWDMISSQCELKAEVIVVSFCNTWSTRDVEKTEHGLIPHCKIIHIISYRLIRCFLTLAAGPQTISFRGGPHPSMRVRATKKR